MKQRRFSLWGAMAVLGILVLGFAMGRMGQGTKLVRTPVVLEQIRSLGDLHLVEHRYHTVLEVDSHRNAAEWTQQIPVLCTVAQGLVESSTRNRGLATVTGSVEAGIDMSRARIEQGGTKLVVVLPEPQIYKPNVEATINHQESALAWNDRNLGLKAELQGSEQFRRASIKAGILEKARENATDEVTKLFAKAGQNNVEVRFESSIN